MKNLLKWIVVSSANPDEVSLTIKGILLQYATFVIAFLSLAHVPVTMDMYVVYTAQFTGAVGTILSIVGLCRKLYFLFKKNLPDVPNV